MMNIYNGNITTDANGEATVALPAYFAVLNKDFRYQLTVIGQFAQAIVAERNIRQSIPDQNRQAHCEGFMAGDRHSSRCLGQ